ncbi:uncharacterized protein LOC117819828 isoform X2 [Notolabrus celidotus]|nr:uncharacterized protein LOC117819828 isoform X2 [Notolabrus celidotus]
MLQWQMEKPVKKALCTYNTSTSNFSGWNCRLKVFEDSNNCSLLLNDITAKDHGKYICAFYKPGYKQEHINLNISATYYVCEKNSSMKSFQCDIRGDYKDADISWRLDGKPLTNSSMYIISRKDTWDASTGLYQFKTVLTTYQNISSKPTCHVKAKVISTKTERCEEEKLPEPVKTPELGYARRCTVIIPLTLAFGVFLFLCHRWRISRSLNRRREEDTPLNKHTELNCDNL